jgi:hypothetical protein
VGTLLVMGGAGLGMLLLTVVAVVRMQRSLDQPGGRQGLGTVGDAFGNFIDVFDPGQARAQRDLRHEEHKGPVTPSPDGDDDDPVRLVTGSDGRPLAVRVRRPAGTQGDTVGT